MHKTPSLKFNVPKLLGGLIGYMSREKAQKSWKAPEGPSGAPWEAPWGSFGVPWGPKGGTSRGSWRVLRGTWGPLVGPWGALGGPCGALECPYNHHHHRVGDVTFGAMQGRWQGGYPQLQGSHQGSYLKSKDLDELEFFCKIQTLVACLIHQK